MKKLRNYESFNRVGISKKVIDLVKNSGDEFDLIAKVDNPYCKAGETIKVSNYNSQFIKREYPDQYDEKILRMGNLPYGDGGWISVEDIDKYFL